MNEDKLKTIANQLQAIIGTLAYLITQFGIVSGYEDKKQLLSAMPSCISEIEMSIRYLKNALEQTLLHPCPFCHGAAEMHTCDGGDYGQDYLEIECTECGCTMTFEEGVTKEEAIKKWNTRK